MAHLNKFLAIKEDILNHSAIRLKGLEKADLPEKNVADFVKAFFVKYNNEYDTVYVSNGKVQTKKGLRRTLQDVFLITYYYFPKVSLSKLYLKLVTLLNEGVIVSAICDKLHKRVYRAKISYDKGTFFNGDMTDEYGIDFQMFNLQNCSFNQVGWGTDYTKDNLVIKKL